MMSETTRPLYGEAARTIGKALRESPEVITARRILAAADNVDLGDPLAAAHAIGGLREAVRMLLEAGIGA